MSTNTSLDDIKARVEGHTEGPWKAWNDAPAHRSSYVETTWSTDGEHAEQITDWCFPADAELIAAAPKLLAALEAVQKLVDETPRLVCFGGETVCGSVVADSITKAIADALE